MLQNSPTSEVSGQKQWDTFLGHPCAWSLRMIGELRFVSEKRPIDGRAIQVDFATGVFSAQRHRAIAKVCDDPKMAAEGFDVGLQSSELCVAEVAPLDL